MNWSSLFSSIGNNIGGIGQAAGLAGAGLLFNKAYENMGEVGKTAQTASNTLAQQALGQTQFRPFTVTTGLGNLQATPEGGYGMNLSAQQQGLQNQLFGGAQGFYGQAMSPTLPAQQALQNQLFAQAQSGFGLANQGMSAAEQSMQNQLLSGATRAFGETGAQLSPQEIALRNQLSNLTQQQFGVAGQGMSPEQAALQRQLTSGASSMYAQALMPQQQRTQQVYNQLRAIQTPEEQRQQLALEERLAGQGRLGVQTAQYGGTPEQFALSKAQAEAQNQAAFAAMEQAQREQAQAAALAGQFQEAGYRPMTELQRQQLAASQLGGISQEAGYVPLQQLLQQRQSAAGLGGALQAAGYVPTDVSQRQRMLEANLANVYQQAGYTPFEKRMQEQAQAAELGRLFQTGGYLPLSSLLSAYQPGLQGSQLASQMQQTGAGLFGEATMGGINALLASRLGQGTLAGNIGSALAQGTMGGMLSQMQEGDGTTGLGNLFGSILGKLQEWAQ